MIVERVIPSGAISISASDDEGYLVSRLYFDYSMEEALALFREETGIVPDGDCEACGVPCETDPDFCNACVADMALKR